LVGGPGYTLPDASDLQEFTFGQLKEGAVPNLVVAGAGDELTNRVHVHPQARLKKKITLETKPNTSRCSLIIGPDCTLWGQIILYGAGHVVILAGGAPSVGHTGHIHVRLWGPKNFVYIGEKSSSNGTAYELSGNDRCVIVGDDCMFAARVRISTTDLHGLMDISTRRWRNPPADIVIEPHVWLADDVTLTKGVVMGLGSVAGNKALVSRSVPRSTAVGGAPAKGIASDICWDRKLRPSPATVDVIDALKARVPPFMPELLRPYS
jgi:hypothetical protein